MNVTFKEILKFIIIFLFLSWIFNITIQFLSPRGIIGVTFERTNDGNVIITNIEENMPAEKAGLMDNDRVITVNGINVEKKSPNYVSSKVKGTPNTNVTITIKRNDELYTYTITRVQSKINWLLQ